MQRAACVFALAFVTGCGSGVTYRSNGVVAPRAPRDPSLMVVQMNGAPGAPQRGITIAGDMHASGGDSAASVELMRREAAKNGLDGVTDIVCAPSGSGDAGSCDGKGFVYSSQ